MDDHNLYTNFSKETWEQFKANERAGPIQMLNLIRLRERAAYSDDRVASGAEAYKSYSDMSAPLFKELGGKIVWRGKPELSMIGPPEEAWDIAFVAEYPTAQAFMALMRNTTYRAAVQHRQAAVLDSRLVRLGAASVGEGFAGELTV